jgi:hypothetical protein
MNKKKWYKNTRLMSLVILLVLVSGCITIQQKKSGDQNTTPNMSLPVINSFTSETQGQTIQLSWNVSGAHTVNIIPTVGEVLPIDTVQVSPPATTTYILTATNDAGNSVANVTVEVTTKVIGKPDLIITDVWIKQPKLYYKVKNQGSERAEGTRAQLYLMNRPIPEVDDYTEPLDPGEERTESFGNYEWDFDFQTEFEFPGFGCFGPPTSFSIPDYQVIVEVCADGEHSIIEGSEENNCYKIVLGQKITYDFKGLAHMVSWRTGAGELDWPSPEDSQRGSAFLKSSMVLEDGKSHATVLGTYPQQVPNGWIQGIVSGFYTDPKSNALMSMPIYIPEKARFTALVGFKRGSTNTDGLKFTFGVQDEIGQIEYFPPILATYDEKLDLYEVDLQPLAQKKRVFILRVEDESGNMHEQNQAVWVNPRITQELE